MIEKFRGKKVKVLVAFSSFMAGGGAIPHNFKGVVTDANENGIILDNQTFISSKYIISLESL
jgi:hypothetical protein